MPSASDTRSFSEHDLLGFCHIEKAAGTSLIHVFRRLFFLRYAAVRPLHAESGHEFTSRDLRTVLRCNPLLRAFGGHAVVPHGDLDDFDRNVRYVTQLREPVARVLSQYRFWRSRMGKSMSVDEFLEDPTTRDYQVRKIAGSDDLELAKRTILDKFLLVGTVDQFDEFLVLLAGLLQRPVDDFTYVRKNVATEAGALRDAPEIETRIARQNRLDAELYRWVRDELLETYVERHDGDFESELRRFRARQDRHSPHRLRLLVDYLYRNAYWKPLTGLIRVRNGLPYFGSYAFRPRGA